MEVRRLAQLTVRLIGLDRPTSSIRLLQTDITFEDRLRIKGRSSHATN